MANAETNGNRYAEVDSALLLTEYVANKDALKEMKNVVEEQRNEIQRRLDMGLDVRNKTQHAYLRTVNYKTYNVAKAISAIRKYKLDPAALLKVINSAVTSLPKEIQDRIPYVEEPTNQVWTKANK